MYSINTVQYPTGKNKKEGTDSLTLVNVFILYTHCHKYRIYFYPEVPTTKSQGWVPTKHTTVVYRTWYPAREQYFNLNLELVRARRVRPHKIKY